MFGRGKIRKGENKNSVTHRAGNGKRHSADLRRSGRAVLWETASTLAAALNRQG